MAWQQQLSVSFACLTVEVNPDLQRPLGQLSAAGTVVEHLEAGSKRSGVFGRLRMSGRGRQRWLHRTEPRSCSAASSVGIRWRVSAADCGSSAFVLVGGASDWCKFGVLESASGRSSAADCKRLASGTAKLSELAATAEAVGSGTEWLAELQLRPRSKRVTFASVSLLLRPVRLPDPHGVCPATAELQGDSSEPAHDCSLVESLCPAQESPMRSVESAEESLLSLELFGDSSASRLQASLEAEFTDSLLAWSRQCTEGYRFVQIDNRHTSFRNGLAFCAIINRFAPWLIDFDFLTNDMRENNRLAFCAAQQLGVERVPDPAALMLHRIPNPNLIGGFLHQLRNRLGRQVPPRRGEVDADEDWVMLDAEQLEHLQHESEKLDECLAMVRSEAGVFFQIDWLACTVL